MNKFSKAAFEEQCMTYILLYVIYEITCSAYILNIHIIYIYHNAILFRCMYTFFHCINWVLLSLSGYILTAALDLFGSV